MDRIVLDRGRLTTWYFLPVEKTADQKEGENHARSVVQFSVAKTKEGRSNRQASAGRNYSISQVGVYMIKLVKQEGGGEGKEIPPPKSQRNHGNSPPTPSASRDAACLNLKDDVGGRSRKKEGA